MTPPHPRVATTEDLDAVTDVLAGAFAEDPLWRWALPGGREQLTPWWRFHVASALRYPWVWIAGEFAAVSVWIPPGGTELTDEEESRVEPVLADLVGSRASAVMELLERFEETHPDNPPHYYLSLLGVDPERRGEGLGMGLLAENLRQIDAEGMPAYLESSNPANISRYERVGFEQVGEFTTPDGSHTVATMWRDAPAPG